ncbi:hypothetical protein [Amylibacter sp. IMCC11727]|uniref:hypothetical protein n=1 Tax=Amylibacter sp. IMCC11727 TaxID=3039851 RepID=UPI00244DDEE6|nr:hypothetical protein [Amylibacter sp. IMCC11727]WGI21429.1 hypothetical protein QBD29_15115 [Amylibacter sp. IMCC11727]
MRNPIAFLFIGLFFGTGIGFIWAGSLGVTFDGHDHAEHAGGGAAVDHANMDHGGMDHSPVNVPAGPNAPTLAMVLHKDTMSGLNLEIQTTNFTFSPETVNQANITGAGHAHVYANGKKLSRVYGNWFHITGLPAGEHTIMVELNANSHGVIQVDGKPLQVTQTVTIP